MTDYDDAYDEFLSEVYGRASFDTDAYIDNDGSGAYERLIEMEMEKTGERDGWFVGEDGDEAGTR